MAAVAACFFSLQVVAQLQGQDVATSQNTTLEFSNVWVRAMPPFQPNTAAYLSLINRGDTAVAIVGASSDVAEKVELHATRKIDGLVRMEQLEGLAVAPGEQVQLAPGGTHLMLLGLAYRPVPGDKIQLCLQLASGDEVCTIADVRLSDTALGTESHQHH